MLTKRIATLEEKFSALSQHKSTRSPSPELLGSPPSLATSATPTQLTSMTPNMQLSDSFISATSDTASHPFVSTPLPLHTAKPPSVQPSVPSVPADQPLQQLQKAPLHPLNNDHSPAFLSRTRATSCSRGNFAVNLNRSWFTEEERLSSNVRGRNGKKELSPQRIQQIHDAVFHMYPLTQNEDPQRAWGECIKAIDVSNRQLKRKGKENNQPNL